MSDCRFDRHGLCLKHPRVVYGSVVLEGAPPMLCDTAAAALQARVKEQEQLLHDAQGLILESGQLLERLEARVRELEAQVLREYQRADGNFASYERVKEKFSRAELRADPRPFHPTA